jgi:hypothetical protein
MDYSRFAAATQDLRPGTFSYQNAAARYLFTVEIVLQLVCCHRITSNSSGLPFGTTIAPSSI